MTVEHWERFCVLRVSRLLMAVINFKNALLLFLLHNPLHVWWYNFPNTSRAVKFLIAALRAPGAPCDGPQALADGDGHHVADVLHHEHMSSFTSDKCHWEYNFDACHRNSQKVNWGFLIDVLHDFLISPELLKLSQWTNERAYPPDTRALHLCQEFDRIGLKLSYF